MTIWRPMRNICLALPEELLIEIDEAAKDRWMNRSECIRELLIKALSTHESKAIEKIRLENPMDPRLLSLDDS